MSVSPNPFLISVSAVLGSCWIHQGGRRKPSEAIPGVGTYTWTGIFAAHRLEQISQNKAQVAMLGALGFLVQEKFAPLFGGNIDGPAVYHFQEIAKVGEEH